MQRLPYTIPGNGSIHLMSRVSGAFIITYWNRTAILCVSSEGIFYPCKHDYFLNDIDIYKEGDALMIRNKQGSPKEIYVEWLM